MRRTILILLALSLLITITYGTVTYACGEFPSAAGRASFYVVKVYRPGCPYEVQYGSFLTEQSAEEWAGKYLAKKSPKLRHHIVAVYEGER